jgi:signal transduction histidine kinase
MEDDLSEKLQLNLYRIVQEQLTNILKHAKASQAFIRLSREGDELILLISDNGKGYDTSKIRKGVGIRNIMSRAESFQGRTEIKSNTGKGYELKVGLPMGQLAR